MPVPLWWLLVYGRKKRRPFLTHGPSFTDLMSCYHDLRSRKVCKNDRLSSRAVTGGDRIVTLCAYNIVFDFSWWAALLQALGYLISIWFPFISACSWLVTYNGYSTLAHEMCVEAARLPFECLASQHPRFPLASRIEIGGTVGRHSLQSLPGATNGVQVFANTRNLLRNGYHGKPS